MARQTEFDRKVNEMRSWRARVEQRMSTPRDSWDDWVWDDSRWRTPVDTPVTPTVCTTPAADGNASPARILGWFADTQAGEIEHRRRQIRRMLVGMDIREADDPMRVERELAASTIHHSIYDLIRGGPGIDRRHEVEIEWERMWRSMAEGDDRDRMALSYPPTYYHRALSLGRDLDLHRQWQECY